MRKEVFIVIKKKSKNTKYQFFSIKSSTKIYNKKKHRRTKIKINLGINTSKNKTY